MCKHIFYTIIIVLLNFSCSSGGDDDIIVEEPPQDIIPTDLNVSIDIVGQSSNALYGDGSGVTNFTASAINAVKYGFIVDNGSEQSSTNGTFQYTFTGTEGIENHDIKVVAYSSTNNTINKTETLAVAYYNGTPPVWADEFFEDGAPDPANWNYNLGAGGWGNSELQTYTNTSENVIVEDGVLKIIAKSDGSGGYTSARIKTESLQEFTYGTVKVRAKLPSKQGTWPAIWMLGADFSSVGWPHCGEIDIMEQTGANKNEVLATCHWYNASNSSTASYGLKTTITNAASQFHIYEMQWDENFIRMSVDGTQYYEIALNSALPFDHDFFLILNVAMGGTLGGTVESGFTQDVMEVDYVRVYQ
ncbi:glycoside hydrolase family 16 protein [Aestuariivivens marinum]|uniref:glycoside hydrolase family 16 protein n=1 Tax=Aestuariivivens marinum TaxID=2913555 RepID=UPI001F592721|nr:glycoside hydrolase family 16 protein [Aestuariivivens marinum]